MPRLGLGTFRVRGEDATRSTLAALRAGCRHVDTASCYRNEEAIRDAIEGWNDETKEADADADAAVFLTSKLAPSEIRDRARTREALLGVFARLGRGAREGGEDEGGERSAHRKPLDLALIHWPAKAGAAPDDASHLVARRDAWSVLERARDAGSVRAIGVSNYTRAHLEEMRGYAERHLPCVNQVELHPRCQQKELRAACAEMNVGVVAYSPLGCGALLEDPRVVRCAARLAAELHVAAARDTCGSSPKRAHGTARNATRRSDSVTPAQALLAWSLRQDGVVAVVCKSADPERAAANVGVEGLALALRLAEMSDVAFEEIDAMDDGTHFCWDPRAVR